VSGLLAPAVAQAASEPMPRALYARTVRSAALIIGSEYWGSGFLVDRERRLVITNWHVVRKGDTVDVVFPAYEDGELITDSNYYVKNSRALAYLGKVLCRRPHHDLALIQLQKVPAGVTALKLAAHGPRVGDHLYRLGTAAAQGPAWKAIPGKVREFLTEVHGSMPDKTVNPVKGRIIETDCGGRYGDSGSAVVNAQGELVGVHFAGSRSTSDAISVQEVRASLEEGKDIPGALYARTVRSAAWLLIDSNNRGSAVLVDRKRKLLLTNYHVVQQAGAVDVVFPAYGKGRLIT
jgi:S1-C subfamily serine protease